MEPHDLYGLPLDRFIPERVALVRSLRKDGRRPEATEVAALRKPSVGAWAVNQLIRTQPQAVAGLFEAGDVLQHAHAGILAGRGGGVALREALARERDAVRELVDKARGLLSSQGHELTPATLERVSETLHAAALDPDARAQLQDGCLHREIRHVGLGAASGFSAAPPPPRAPKGAEGRAGGRTPSAADRTRHGQPEADRIRTEQERTKQLRAAEKAEADARRAAERAERELERAEHRRELAADSLRDAEAVVDLARERVEQAALAYRQARQALERR